MRIWGMTTESHVRLSPEDKVELEGWVAGRNTPQKLVWRARIVLMWRRAPASRRLLRRLGRPSARHIVGATATWNAVSKACDAMQAALVAKSLWMRRQSSGRSI